MKHFFSLFAVVFVLIYGFNVFAEYEDRNKDRVIVVKRFDTIAIDYFYGNIHVAHFDHFLKNHPRYEKYYGHAIFYKKALPTRAWIDRKREIAIVHYGDLRCDCSSYIYRNTICKSVKEGLLYWEKRLDIQRRIKETGGEP